MFKKIKRKIILRSLRKAISKGSVVYITGSYNSGKSWLLRQAGVNDALSINVLEHYGYGKEDRPASFKPNEKLVILNEELLAKVYATKKPLVSLDEANLVSDDIIVSIANHCLNTGKKLVLTSQVYNYPLVTRIQQQLSGTQLMISVGLDKWDLSIKAPSGHRVRVLEKEPLTFGNNNRKLFH